MGVFLFFLFISFLPDHFSFSRSWTGTYIQISWKHSEISGNVQYLLFSVVLLQIKSENNDPLHLIISGIFSKRHAVSYNQNFVTLSGQRSTHRIKLSWPRDV